MAAALVDVPIGMVRCLPQVRQKLDERGIDELAASIALCGVLVPLLGHREGTEVVVDDGHRRHEAAARAGLDSVPMLLSDTAPSAAERLTLQLVASAHRADLGVMEKARAIRRLMDETGWAASEVSATLGRPSPAMISKLLTLLVLPSSIQDLIDEGKIPVSSAYAVATVADPAERDRLVDEIAGGRLKRDELVKQVKATKQGRTPRTSRKSRAARKERLVFPLGEGCSVTVSAISLTAESVALALAELSERIRAESQSGRPLPEIARLLRAC